MYSILSKLFSIMLIESDENNFSKQIIWIKPEAHQVDTIVLLTVLFCIFIAAFTFRKHLFYRRRNVNFKDL